MVEKDSSGMSVLGVLQMIFIVLKSLNLISWSWPVVLIPLWISLGMLFVALIFLLICGVIDGWKRKQK